MAQPVAPALQVVSLGVNVLIPSKDKFGTEPYISAPALAELGNAVIAKHAKRLQSAAKFEITYLWKATGGSKWGQPNYGDCQLASGLVAYALGSDFVIWFAGDHLSEVGFMADQLEALMFRCLCHIGVNNNTGSPKYLGADVHCFRDEIPLYGLWDIPLKELGKVMQAPVQSGLFDALDMLEDEPESAAPAETDPDKIAEQAVNSKRGGRRGLAVVPPTTPNGHDPADTEDDPFPVVPGRDGIGADPDGEE